MMVVKLDEDSGARSAERCRSVESSELRQLEPSMAGFVS